MPKRQPYAPEYRRQMVELRNRKGWGEDCLRVKRLNRLEVHGNSMHRSYLGFFLAARHELWEALGRE